MVVGGYVTSSGAGDACEMQPTRYPLCNGSLLPDFSLAGVPQEYAHRILTFFGGFLVLVWLVQAWRTQRNVPLLPRLTTGTFLLLLLQSAIGAVRVTSASSGPERAVVVTAHLGMAMLVFGLAIVTAMLAWAKGGRRAAQPADSGLTEPESKTVGDGEPAAGSALGAGTWRDYLALTKPRIVLLLLVTTLTGYVMATGDSIDPATLTATLVAGALVSGGAESLNNYLERGADAKMKRTMRRPLPTGRLGPERALFLGLALIGVSTFVFVWFVNLLALTLALAGAAFYVLVYTIYLKPRTVQNIVIGGAAGGFPVLVGWAAATGSLAVPPLLLFILIFLWTPPHFWALALVYREDYERAGVPMLPVVRGEAVTVRSIVAYSALLVAFSFAFVLTGAAGLPFTAVASLLGGALMYLTIRLARATERRPAAFRLFKFTGVYLLLTCIALIFSAVLPV
jgi:protoheme IX farnesyltransferase